MRLSASALALVATLASLGTSARCLPAGNGGRAGGGGGQGSTGLWAPLRMRAGVRSSKPHQFKV